jgi:hypothetical protein
MSKKKFNHYYNERMDNKEIIRLKCFIIFITKLKNSSHLSLYYIIFSYFYFWCNNENTFFINQLETINPIPPEIRDTEIINKHILHTHTQKKKNKIK